MKFVPQMRSKCIRHSASPCGPAAACSCAAKAKWAALSGRSGHWRTQAECSSGDREMVRLDPDSTESRRAELNKATDDALAAVPEAEYVKGQPPFARCGACARQVWVCAHWTNRCLRGVCYRADVAAKMRRTRGRQNPPHTRPPKSAAHAVTKICSRCNTFKKTFLSS